jgi:hypothetical protein
MYFIGINVPFDCSMEDSLKKGIVINLFNNFNKVRTSISLGHRNPY